MDFDLAAKRLQRDQSKLRRSNRNNKYDAVVVGQKKRVELSAQAAKEAAENKAKQRIVLQQREQARKKQRYLQNYIQQCEASLGIQCLGKGTRGGEDDSAAAPLLLRPTSIHGEGDKIALPPSVLERLTAPMASAMDLDGSQQQRQQQQQQPWTFRIGILNPDYCFPSSSLLQSMPIKANHNDEDASNGSDDDSEIDSDRFSTKEYLDEMRHKYRTYTHGTVVEFTQEEGNVGLPESIARALLSSQQSSSLHTHAIPTMRTKDAAAAAVTSDGAAMQTDIDGDHDSDIDNRDETKTPGHLAWGAFDLPDCPVEITLLKLPRGKTARLQPTRQAVQNGFYRLKDIKLVLEQSLVRTRATLSVHDAVSTWHRGERYDLVVTDVTPNSYCAVSIIDTDLEIEFDAPVDDLFTSENEKQDGKPVARAMGSGGRRLADECDATTTTTAVSSAPAVSSSATNLSLPTVVLPSEPPMEQMEHVVTIQIRGPDGSKVQRRFDTQSQTIDDVFALAQSILGSPEQQQQAFQLITRFPRRVFLSNNNNSNRQTLAEAGIVSKQELFMMVPL